MAFKVLTKKSVFFILLLALVLLLIKLQSTINLVLPANTVTKWVSRALERELSVQVGLEDVRVTVLPFPSIQVFGVRLLDQRTGNPWVRADLLEVRLKLIPIFQGRILPAKIVVRSPVFQLQRDAKGQWLFMGLLHKGRQTGQGYEAHPLRDIPIRSVLIKDASVEVLDHRHPSAEPYRLLQEMDGGLKGISTKSPFRIKVNGHFPHKLFELNSFSINGEVALNPGSLDLRSAKATLAVIISNLPEEIARPYLREFLDLELFSGRIDLETRFTLTQTQEVDISGELLLKKVRMLVPQYASEPLSREEAVLSFALSRDEEVVNVRHLAVSWDETSIWGHGVWARNFNGGPWYGLSMHAANLSFERIRAYLPDVLLPARAVDALRGASSRGSFDIPLLEIRGGGSALSPEEGNDEARRCSIKIAFHDFGLDMGPEYLPFESVNGEVLFNPEEIGFHNLTGSYGSSHIRTIHGTLPLGLGGATDLKADARLNLREVQGLILGFPESLREKFFLSYMDGAKGYAEISMEMASTSHGGPPIALNGSMDLIGAGFVFPFIRLELSHLYGRLSFEDSHVLPFILKARIEEVPTEVTGEVRRAFTSESYFTMNISGRPSEQVFRKWFPFFQKGLTFQGEDPRFKLLLDGTPKEMRFDTTLEFSETSLSVSDWITKKAGLSSTLHFTGYALGRKQMVIEQGTWQVAGETLGFSGSIEGGTEPLLSLMLESDRLSLEPLAPVFPLVAGSGSGAALSGGLNISYRPQRKGSLDMKGSLLMSGVVAHPRLALWPLENINGTLLFSGREVSARGVRCQWRSKPLTLDLRIPFADALTPEFRLHLPFVDLGPIVDEIFSAEAAGFSRDERSLRRSEFQAELFLQDVEYGRIKLQDFQAHLSLAKGVVTISSFQMSGLGGEAKGRGWIDLVAAENPLFQTEADISGVSAEEYLRLFLHNRTFYAGEISGSIGVQGTLYPDLVKTARKMNGQADLLIQSIREKNYLINLSREIAKRVDIIMGTQDERFRVIEYDEMGGGFEIRDGKFHSTNFYMNQYNKYDVSGMTMDKLTAAVPIRIKYNIQAAGSYDFLDTSIDCFIMAQPFSMATKIVKKFPLAGKVLTGEDESLYSVYFHFNGQISYKYRGTERGAKLQRVAFQDLSEQDKEALKGPG